MKPLDVRQGWINPQHYDVDEHDCWIWKHAMGKAPVMRKDGHNTIVRRVYLGENVRPNQRVLMTCEQARCVNPAHYQLQETARVYVTGYSTDHGLILGDGSLAERAYGINDHGCWLWNGAMNTHATGTAFPVGIWRGKQVSVRQHVMGAARNEHIATTCGEVRCVNPAHLFSPSRVVMERLDDRVRDESRREGDGFRKLAWIRADLLAMLQDIKVRPPGMSIAAWNSAVRYATGDTLQEIANADGVTRQAVSLRIRHADRRLRKLLAQSHLR